MILHQIVLYRLESHFFTQKVFPRKLFTMTSIQVWHWKTDIYYTEEQMHKSSQTQKSSLSIHTHKMLNRDSRKIQDGPL